jgi:hypothetical protein
LLVHVNQATECVRLHIDIAGNEFVGILYVKRGGLGGGRDSVRTPEGIAQDAFISGFMLVRTTLPIEILLAFSIKWTGISIDTSFESLLGLEIAHSD